ncbi:MAG: zinc-binding dehydrogenase, partial [Caldilineales bacterium]|nr:zinc-binding dehydrogenase [Caldilineales bacterium]
TVAVFGAGGVGLSIIMAAQLAGAGQIIAVDKAAAKAQIARDCGATAFLTPGPGLIEEIRARSGGRGADYVFEAIGIPAVQEQCLAAVRPGGLVVLVGVSAMGSATNLPGAILTRQEKTVTGSYYGSANTARDFPRFLELYRRGRLDLDRLVSQTYRLHEINQAYADMLAGANARGVILFD